MPRILILLMLLATRAGAGAWPLPEGAGNLSFSFEGERGDDSGAYTTLYTEYGLAGSRTAGLDLGLAERDADKAVAFLRWHPGAPKDEATLVAYELGLGMVDKVPALRPGLSLGRPVTLGGRHGWAAADARAVIKFPDEVMYQGLSAIEHRFELDLTLGGDIGRGNKWLVQLQTGAPSDADPYAKIAPSYAYEQATGRHLLIGMAAGILGVEDVRLTLGLWQKF